LPRSWLALIRLKGVDESSEAIYRKQFAQAERSAAAQFQRDAGRRVNIAENQRDKGWLLSATSPRPPFADGSSPEIESRFVELLSLTNCRTVSPLFACLAKICRQTFSRLGSRIVLAIAGLLDVGCDGPILTDHPARMKTEFAERTQFLRIRRSR
jgi:hypothetical protein